MINKSIPKYWVSCTLKDIGQIVAGGTPSTTEKSYWDGDVSWITPADLSKYNRKYISQGRKSITLMGLSNSSAKLLPMGSVLFSSRAPIGYVVISAKELSTNQGFKSIVPFEGIDSSYLYYYLLSIKEIAREYASGTTFKEISASVFATLPFLLPPLPEQRAIVAKLETLLSELDNAVASLKQAKEQLKTYRQSVLKAAFTGKLTEEWRKQQNGHPSTEELLTQIETERQKYYEQQLADYKLGKQKTKPKKPSSVEYLDNEDKRRIPYEWMYVRFGDLVDNVDANRIPLSQEYRKTFKGTYPYYGACSIIDFVHDYLFDGEYLLIGEDGANLLSKSKPLAFRVSGKFWVNNHAHILKIIPTSLIGFIEFQFNLNDIGQYVTGTAQPKLTQVNLDKIPIAYCSLDEQQIIENEINARFSTADQLDQTIDESLVKAEALKQSLLKQAFEGRLLNATELTATRQAADWEPAEKLLERIRAKSRG